MPAFPSPAWQEAAAELVAGDLRLQGIRSATPVVLAQTVTAEDDADDVVAAWHVIFGPQGVVWRSGATPDADVSFTCSQEIASSIQSGDKSAQAAFMAGDLRIGGDVTALLAMHELLQALADALAPLRSTSSPRRDA